MRSIKFNLLFILLCVLSSCNAQKSDNGRMKINSPVNLSFINNKNIRYSIKKVACDSCFPITDIGYRVRISLSQNQDRRIKEIGKKEWMRMLNNNNTDYAANVLLYYIYNRDAFVLLYNRNIQDWRAAMKDDDILYWKQTLK